MASDPAEAIALHRFSVIAEATNPPLSPARSAAQIAAILFARHHVAVSERTIRDWLVSRGLTRKALQSERASYGRFEASRPNEIWVGDVLVGPFVPHPRTAGSVRARLF